MTRDRGYAEDERLAKSAESQGYTEHAKLYRLHGENDTVGFSLDWLRDQNIWLAQYESGYGAELVPIDESTHKILARYFEIDEAKVDEEKRKMLDDIRAVNEARSGSK